MLTLLMISLTCHGRVSSPPASHKCHRMVHMSYSICTYGVFESAGFIFQCSPTVLRQGPAPLDHTPRTPVLARP